MIVNHPKINYNFPKLISVNLYNTLKESTRSPMNQNNTNTWNGKSFVDCIKDLTDNGAFEIWSPVNTPDYKQNIYIPYMMNDAMECYFILGQATLVGHFDRTLMSETCVSYEEQANADSRHLLVVKQGDENTCTIWFSSVEIKQDLYRFDEICHYWRSGNEQWSQMTYMIGTMYDKFLFNGSNVCNSTEQSIMHLIEFAPFRAFAPAPALFEELYDNTWDGLKTMISLAKEAKDYRYYILCKLYGKLSSPFFGQFLGRMLMNGLTKRCRYPLYQLIYKKAIKGASSYPARHYMNPYENEKITNLRFNTHEKMIQAGFTGTYPEYTQVLSPDQSNIHTKSIYVRITEEQPFTIMDWEDITFSQRFMVSYSSGTKNNFNLGFFHKKGLSHDVLSPDDFFKKLASN